jgi:DNA-directed RNA polymerase specialized sigma24 family protein
MGSDDRGRAAGRPPGDGSWVHNPSDAELIAAVRGGDRAAFGALRTRHAVAAATLARLLARSPGAVDDLVTAAFAELLDALAAGGGPDSAFRIELFTAVRHAARGLAEADATPPSGSDPAGQFQEAADSGIAPPQPSLLTRAFDSLPERWQATLWHALVERESPQQVAVLVGLSPNGVTSLTTRARQALREAWVQAYAADTTAEECRTTAGRLGTVAQSAEARPGAAQIAAHIAECSGCRALEAELSALDHSPRALLAQAVLGDAAGGYLAAADATKTTITVPAEVDDEPAETDDAPGVGLTAKAVAPDPPDDALPAPAVAPDPPDDALESSAAPAELTAPSEPGSDSAAPAESDGPEQSPTSASWWTRPRLIAAFGVVVVAAVVAAVAIWTAAGADDPGVDSALAAPVSAASASSMTPPSPAAPSPSDPQATDPVSAGSMAAIPPPSASVPTSTTPATTDPTEPTGIPTGLTATTSIATATSAPVSTSPDASADPSKAAPTTPAPDKPKPPPAITLTPPAFTTSAITAMAGDAVTATFTVTNTAASASSSRTSTITFPRGVSLADVTIAVEPARSGLRHASVPALAALRLPARYAAIVRCVGNSCTYTVPPASRVSITLHIAVAADARSGHLVLRTPGAPAAVIDVAVQRPAPSSAAPATSAPAHTTATASTGTSGAPGSTADTSETPASTGGAIQL